jgi:hypothetical protein
MRAYKGLDRISGSVSSIGILVWTTVLIGIAQVAFADPIPVNNHSFEAANLADGGWSDCIDIEDLGDGCAGDPNFWVQNPNNSNNAFAEVIGGFSSDGTHHLGVQQGQIVTQSLSGVTFLPNRTYKLTASVGNRPGQTQASNQSIFGLTVGGVEVGRTTIDANTVDPLAYQDFEFTFPVGAAPPAGTLGIFVGSAGGGRGHFDNIRLEFGTSFVDQAMSIRIDRGTGAMTLVNGTASAVAFSGTSILSGSGALNNGNWVSIAGNYDANGNGSVSGSVWNIFSSTRTDLSEGTLGTGSLAASANANLGNSVWTKSFREDVTFSYINPATGLPVSGPVRFAGGINNLPYPEGDFNFDGSLSPLDWPTVRDNYGNSTPTLTAAQSYGIGDINGDLVVDLNDLLRFKVVYDAANGAGAFEAMIPEPTGVTLFAMGLVLTWFARRRLGATVMIVVPLLFGMVANVQADPIPVNNFSFEDANLPDGGWSDCIDVDCGGLDPDHWVDDPLNGANAFAEVIAGFSADGTHHLGIQNQTRVRQTLTGVALQPNSVYTLRAAVGNRPGQTQTGNRTIFGLSVGGTDLGALTTSNASTIPAGSFADRRYVHITGASVTPGDIAIELGVASLDRAHFDNIRLDRAALTNYSDLLALDVNTSSGLVRLKNAVGFVSMDIDFYEITSGAGSLRVANWSSLQDQDYEGNGAPGTGNGWEELGNSSANRVSEFYLTGSSVLAGGATNISLGNLFNPAGARDLRLSYHLTDGSVLPGPVFYVTGIDGDFNNDGIYNCADINALTTAVATGGSVAQFDLNGDGSLTLGDVNSWRSEAGGVNIGPGRSYRVGDANLDTVVDGSDFGIWNTHKFTSNTNWCNGNFNADTVVDGTDFGQWNSNKFTSSDGTAVPEPTFLLGFLTTMAALCIPRQGVRI